MAYQSRPAMRSRTVTVCSYCDGGNMPSAAVRGSTMVAGAGGEQTVEIALNSDPLDENVVRYLAQDGIVRVLVGHKPAGDSPAIISYAASMSSALPSGRVSSVGLEVISADISYSDSSAPDNRGENAWCEVIIDNGSSLQSTAIIRGALSDARTYEFSLPECSAAEAHPPRALPPVDDLVGHVVVRNDAEGDWWVKARLSSDKISTGGYLLSRGSGRNVEYWLAKSGEEFTTKSP